MAQSSRANKADTAVKLVLMFFISLLSFSVGTYVGKQFSDNEAHRAALEADYAETTAMAEQNNTHIDSSEATAPVADSEVESLTEEFTKKEREMASERADENAGNSATEEAAQDDGYVHRTKMKAQDSESYQAQMMEKAKPTQGAPTGKPTAEMGQANTKQETGHAAPKATEAMKAKPAQAETSKVSTAAERVSNNMAPSADFKKVREPASVLPTVATTAIGKYTVQVASYASESEAKDHASKLSGKGYSAFYIPADINGKTWFRVSIGLFSDQKSASSFRSELLTSQTVSTAIVQKIVK